jgi:outer membrane beta-barrel protein
VLSALMLCGASGWAQEEGPDAVPDNSAEAMGPMMSGQPNVSSASEGAESAAGAATVEAKGPAVSEANETMEWAARRGIETVQKRPIQKEGRFAATAYTGVIPNNIFERYYPVGLRLDYYILENIGVELSGAYAIGSDTGLIDELKDARGAGSTGVLLGDKQIAHFNFGVTWSPIFGKTSWLNNTINYFDFYVFAGFGLLVKQTQGTFNADPSSGVAPEGALGAGMIFFLSNDWAVRADYRQFVFQKITGGVANPSEVSLGLTYFLF